MRRTEGLLIGVALAACVHPAVARGCTFDIRPGRLGDVAAAIGQCAGVTVTVPDPAVAALRSPGVRGRLPVRAAIARALRGTGAEALFQTSDVVRIVRARRAVEPMASSRLAPPPRPAPQPTVSVPDEPEQEIVVTASKQRLRLVDYPGAVMIVDVSPAWAGRNGADGTAAITRTLPAIQATDLGQGRDKLFIRGVADSSFRGQTQAATGQYLGDVRLTFNAPDPSLNLYDMRRVEVLVGPQAPLYGAGSLGGVIRLVPNAPDPGAPSATMSVNVAATRHGGIGRDMAAMMNVPIVSDRLAARVVVFDAAKAGYIDAPRQGRRDINEVRSGGHRAVLRLVGTGDWTIDVGDVLQDLRSADGQYTVGDALDLTRNVPMAEPFASRYGLRYVTASRETASSQLVTTTARVDHALTTVFDGSGLFGPGAVYREKSSIGIWSHETRWSARIGSSRLLVGASAIRSISNDRAKFGEAEVGNAVTFRNRNLDAALFGSYSRPFGRDLTMTAGGRLSYASSDGRVLSSPTPGRFSRQGLRFSPVLALNWQPSGPLSAYARHEHGYRAGGLSVFPERDRVVSQAYRPDTLALSELGLRIGAAAPGRVSARVAAFYADWMNVQADIATFLGLTLTANVGRGRVAGLDAEVLWTGPAGWSFKGDLFVNDGRLRNVAGARIPLNARRLPSVAGAGGRLALDWTGIAPGGRSARSGAALRYVGRSRLGVGEALNIPQGNYLVADVAGSIDVGRFTLAAKLENVFDRRGNTFSFGNPFTVIFRDQTTPLRPRTLAIGIDARF